MIINVVEKFQHSDISSQRSHRRQRSSSSTPDGSMSSRIPTIQQSCGPVAERADCVRFGGPRVLRALLRRFIGICPVAVLTVMPYGPAKYSRTSCNPITRDKWPVRRRCRANTYHTRETSSYHFHPFFHSSISLCRCFLSAAKSPANPLPQRQHRSSCRR